jgi:hypothetical protein
MFPDYELPRAKALRLPASQTDSIPLTGYGGRISTGLKSLRPIGNKISIEKKLYKPNAIHHRAEAVVLSCLVSVNIASFLLRDTALWILSR